MNNTENNNGFWANKRVLVTGAGGFIGSHLTEALVQQGADVKAFLHYNSRTQLGLLQFTSPDILNKIEIIFGDLRDLTALMDCMQDVEIVFHLGALISIPYSYLHPGDVVETNVIGTLNVLQAARRCNVSRIVHTSTSEVYGTAQREPIDEAHPLCAQSPYAASKISADKLAESFFRTYKLPVVTVRPFNTFGPRQSNRAVIPTIISQVLIQDKIYLGNLDTYRDFTFVNDTVEGFLCAGKKPDVDGKTFNLGVGKKISVGDLVKEVGAITGRSIQVEIDSKRLRPETSEVFSLISDNRRAGLELGWKPIISLREGLKRTTEWISTNLTYYDTRHYHI
jgi:dTDP-glucose 4,6-dehydratase